MYVWHEQSAVAYVKITAIGGNDREVHEIQNAQKDQPCWATIGVSVVALSLDCQQADRLIRPGEKSTKKKHTQYAVGIAGILNHLFL